MGSIWRSVRVLSWVIPSEFNVRSLLRKIGAGDGDRTRNIQLGKVNTALFIFNTYKTAHEKCTCMQRIPCMRCLICVSLRDVCGTVSCTNFTSLERAL